MRTWPPMNNEERAVLSLPPVLQRRMARLVLLGWKIAHDNEHRLAWTAQPPMKGPAWAHISRATLPVLLNELVGYDVVS